MHIDHRRTPILWSALLLVLTLFALGGPAYADDNGSEGDPTAANDTLRFGIGPANFVPDGQVVDGRPYLNYVANPGATITDSVALFNFDDKPLTLDLYATDATTANDGAFSLLPGDARPADAGSWIKLDLPKSGKVTVPPRTADGPGRKVVGLTATIPVEATPGDHVGGVLASLKATSTNEDGAQLTLDQRIGLRTYFRLTGDLKPEVRVEDVKASYDYQKDPLGRGDITVSYTVHNTGNMRMDVGQEVSVRRWFASDPSAKPAPLQDLLPGGSVRVTQTFTNRFGLGPLKATVTLYPTAVDDTYSDPIPTVTATKGFWALPWVLIAIIVGIVLLLSVFFGRRWSRRRNKRHVEALVSRQTSSSQPAKGGRRKALVRVTVALGLAGSASLSGLVTGATQAEAPQDSLGEVILETGDATGVPRLALLDGFWGHEGGKKADDLGATFISMNLAGENGGVTEESKAALHEALEDGGAFDNLRVAFVPASADGSNERPEVKKGDNVADVYDWFGDFGMGTSLSGNTNPEDSVATVSTGDEFIKWWDAGQPLQGYTKDLSVIDIAGDGSTRPATAPRGKSILDRWPAGQKISLVLYLSDGTDPQRPGLPTVAVGKDGRALASWLTFETVASPDDASRSSAGYKVLTGKGTGKEAPLPPGGLDEAINGPAGDGQGDGAMPSDGSSPPVDATADTDGDGVPDVLEDEAGADEGSAGPVDRKGDEKSTNALVSNVPGGAPVFAIGLVLVVLLVAAGATRWLRSARSSTRPGR